jgi:ABC-type transporter Mla subunit MlaD
MTIQNNNFFITMNKAKIQAIELEVNQLTQKRAAIFNEWIKIVKQNDRQSEETGKDSPELLKKADALLEEQRSISKQIVKLLEKIDTLAIS